MKTNEVEKLLGVSKQTLYFYEREGLVVPKRDTNDYRIYEDEHLQTLKLIKLLREMDISIDDIKRILRNELSFQECLEKRKIHLEESLKHLEEIKETVEVLKEKEVPLLSNLESIDTTKYPFILGLKKTTTKVSLGRRLTKKHLVKKVVQLVITWIFLMIAVIIGHNNVLKDFLSLEWAMLPATLLILAFFLEYLGEDPFVEFDETGVTYYKYKGIKDKWNYIKAILSNNEQKYIKHVAYEEITRVEVYAKKRYMKILGTNLPQSFYTMDLKFYFKNKDVLSLISPVMLENDQQWFASILLDKVKTIKDNDSILEALARGENLHVYMTQVK